MKNSIIILVVLGCLSCFKSIGQHLTKVVNKGNINEVQTIIRNGGNVNEHSRLFCFPLLYAVMNKNVKMVELLLENNAKLDTCPDSHPKSSLCGRTSFSPFYWAINLNQIDIVKKFCEHGFDINKKIDGVYFTYPLIYSAQVGNSVIFNLLLEKGADFTVKDFWGNNALMYSCSANNMEMAIKLLQKGVDVTLKSNYGENALMLCCSANNLEMFDKLLPKFSSVNDTTRSGYTALMYGARVPEINFKIINALISKGADLNYTNSKNESAFSLACLHNNWDLALYFLDNGTNIKECDFESNARMYHFSGDYYLAKGDLSNSKKLFEKSKKFYVETLSNAKKELSNINAKKADNIVLDILTVAVGEIAIFSLQTNQMHDWQSIGMSKSNAYLMTMPLAENLRKLYSPVFEKNEILLYDYQFPAGASLDEQKVFYKNKINQLEMSIQLIDGTLACIDKGLTGKELNSCISGIQLIEESKKYEKQKKQKERTEDVPDYY
jgi:ankyrin repeat protein